MSLGDLARHQRVDAGRERGGRERHVVGCERLVIQGRPGGEREQFRMHRIGDGV